ncbi:MAG: hypothetical protein RLZZ96_1414 [Bacteroidota bacterium]|jgi:hypothetical protein
MRMSFINNSITLRFITENFTFLGRFIVQFQVFAFFIEELSWKNEN